MIKTCYCELMLMNNTLSLKETLENRGKWYVVYLTTLIQSQSHSQSRSQPHLWPFAFDAKFTQERRYSFGNALLPMTTPKTSFEASHVSLFSNERETSSDSKCATKLGDI